MKMTLGKFFCAFLVIHFLALIAALVVDPQHPHFQNSNQGSLFDVPIYLPVVLLGWFSWFGIYGYLNYRKNREIEEVLQREKDERRKAEQESIRSDLTQLNANSLNIAANLSALIHTAEKALDRAEYEFADGAFIPFWDAIEMAATKLAIFESGCRRIAQNAERYRNQIPTIDAPKPAFELGGKTLPDAREIAERMRVIVRPALKDPDFTKIYLMCRQNRILVAGFSTLGDTINELKNRLESSTSDIRDELEKARTFSEEESETRRGFERQQLKMLDNIQQRKRPKNRDQK